jgi:hypothetical protein
MVPPAMTRYVATVFGVGMAVLIGCAAGDAREVVSYGNPTEPAGEPTDEGSSRIPPPTQHDGEEEEDAGGDVSSSSSSSSGSHSSSTSSGGSTSSSGATSSSGGPSAPSGSTCAKAVALSDICGDEGTDTQSATGSDSKWFVVRLYEDSLSTIDMTLKATLTSPADVNFDLFMYSDVSKNCSMSATAKSTSTGTSDTATVTTPDKWGGANNRSVVVEVRHVSGTVDPAAKWTLKLEGNKP